MFTFYEVGGVVRDKYLNIKSKDVDFSVVSTVIFSTAREAFYALESYLEEKDFQIFECREEFMTIRAKVPQNHELRSRTDVADFVLARKDGPSSDGRHPDYVLPGTLHDDLSRRDFTVNSMAIDLDGNLIDPFNGLDDLKNQHLRFVGDPFQRISEDGLRVIRALRFEVTKNLNPIDSTFDALNSDLAVEMLAKVPIERVYGELEKMFLFNSVHSMKLLSDKYSKLQSSIFRNNLRLQPTLKK
jgi:tRNA nucleotidyltransferase (CCA-adding enzyme)